MLMIIAAAPGHQRDNAILYRDRARGGECEKLCDNSYEIIIINSEIKTTTPLNLVTK